MDATYKHHSRRSHPNLHHLSLAPLTPQFPLPFTTDDPNPIPTSYLTPRSLPQTPSILSRSSSRTRIHPQRASKSTYALASLSDSNPSLLPISKSSTYLATQYGHTGRKTPKSKSTPSTDWLLQTASALTTTTAESKGQAWLATRTSSTSLATCSPQLPAPSFFYEPISTPALDSSYSYTPYRRPSRDGAEADDEFSPDSLRYGGAFAGASRSHSRFPSAKGSRVGIMTPQGVRTPGERDEVEGRGFFDGGWQQGPMFVDVDEEDEGALGEEEEDVDEGEMRRLVWGRVGGWVDWAVGWMDFRGEEGGEKDDEGNTEVEGGDGAGRDGVDGRKRRRGRDESDRIMVKSGVPDATVDVPPPQGDGAWNDAAWLLSVAAKALV